jgi:hypothetical protein
MNSMETLSHGLFRISRGMYSSYFFLYMDFILWHWTQVATKCSTSCFISGQYNLFPMTTLVVFPHSALPWAHHDVCGWEQS